MILLRFLVISAVVLSVLILCLIGYYALNVEVYGETGRELYTLMTLGLALLTFYKVRTKVRVRYVV